MASIHTWTVGEFYANAVKASEGNEEWFASVVALGTKAHDRGDGVAVYVNQDLGSPDVGQWQVVSYGSEASQLVVEEEDGSGALSLPPLTLPDIGGRINWRYVLAAIVPSYAQKEKAGV